MATDCGSALYGVSFSATNWSGVCFYQANTEQGVGRLIRINNGGCLTLILLQNQGDQVERTAGEGL